MRNGEALAATPAVPPLRFTPAAPAIDHLGCRLADRLAASSGERPEVCVMAGGWRRFARELQEADLDLVEDYC